MRPLLLLLVLLLPGILPAHAQIAPTGPALAATTPAASDTAAALHRLFERNRHRQWALPLTLAVGGGLTTMGLTYKPRTKDPLDAGLNAIFTALIGTATTAVVASELVHYGRYTHRRERRALAQWQVGHLPAGLRRRLTAQYFVAP